MRRPHSSAGRWASTTAPKAPRRSTPSTILRCITGNIGRAGASPFSITGQCNAMGTREAGFSSALPGYRKFEIATGSRGTCAAVESAGRSHSHASAASPIPTSSKPPYRERFARSGSSAPIRWSRFPNIDVLKHGLANLDFLVVQDGFHPTPTTELADLVLPAAIWGEKEGTYTNSERRVSKVNAAVNPPGEARSDFDIFLGGRRTARLPRGTLSRLARPARCLR